MRQTLFNFYGVAILIFLSFWFVGAAFGSYDGFLFGIFLAWAYLYSFNTISRLHWRRLTEPGIMLFLGILAVTHAIPGLVVFSVFPQYFLFFLTIALLHIGIEVFIITSRKPKPKPTAFDVTGVSRK